MGSAICSLLSTGTLPKPAAHVGPGPREAKPSSSVGHIWPVACTLLILALKYYRYIVILVLIMESHRQFYVACFRRKKIFVCLWEVSFYCFTEGTEQLEFT